MRAAIKCPLVKCPSWPELGPKLPPWLWAGRERSNPGWRIDTDETAETNITRHYNNNVTMQCYEIWILYQLCLILRMISLWPGGDLVSCDDKIIICIMMTFAWRVTIVTWRGGHAWHVAWHLVTWTRHHQTVIVTKNTPYYCFNLTPIRPNFVRKLTHFFVWR